jgi:hypothetical protein
MQSDFSPIAPFLMAALVIFAVYRRLRRSFGRQLLRPKVMTLRIVLLAVIGCAMLPAAAKSLQYLGAELAGLALGIALGLWGAPRTRFQSVDGRMYYVPHTYTGLAVSMLFLGRLLYRGFQAYAGGRGAFTGFVAAPAGTPGASALNSPLTLATLFVLVGYYVYFYGWVLSKSRHLDAADLETVAAPVAGE